MRRTVMNCAMAVSCLSAPTVLPSYTNTQNYDIRPHETHISSIGENHIIPLSESTRSFNRIDAELQSYLLLEEDWDGYEGIAPKEDVVQTSKKFLALLKDRDFPLPQTMLSGQGEVGLYWEEKNTGYLEIGFDEADCFSFYIEKDGQEFGDDDLPFEDINSIPGKILNQLMDFRNA